MCRIWFYINLVDIAVLLDYANKGTCPRIDNNPSSPYFHTYPLNNYCLDACGLCCCDSRDSVNDCAAYYKYTGAIRNFKDLDDRHTNLFEKYVVAEDPSPHRSG